MNIHDLIPGLEDKDLEANIKEKYETDFNAKNPLTQITIEGTAYELFTPQYNNLMQIITETNTPLEEIKKYKPKYFEKYFGLTIENNQITKLQIQQYGLTKIPYLETLTKLQTLNLYKNQITEIKGLDKLTNLQELSLWNNQIKEITGLDKLTNLQKIDLEYNQIINSDEKKKAISELKQRIKRIII